MKRKGDMAVKELVYGIIFVLVVGGVIYAKVFRKSPPWRTNHAYTAKYPGGVLDSLRKQVKNQLRRGR